jgi:biopolymer transport protein ExbD
MFRKPKIKRQDAELDITSFMNLMIVLVPVLLMMMVFSHITVLELQLPGLTKLAEQTELLAADDEIEVVVRKQGIKVFYPQGKLINDIARIGDTYDYPKLVDTLKSLKSLLRKHEIPKKSLSLLLEADIDYQTIITLMDKSRSYEAVVVASVVDAELFPDISLGDAPSISGEGEGR